MSASGIAINARALATLMQPPDEGLSDDFRDVLTHICNQVTEISDLHKRIEQLETVAELARQLAAELLDLLNVAEGEWT